MTQESSKIFSEARKIWKTAVSAPSEIQRNPVSDLEIPMKLLTHFQAGSCYYMVFNVVSSEFEFISEEIKTVLGYDPHEMNANLFLNSIHPDDKNFFLAFEKQSTTFLTGLPLEKRSRFKYQHDYRIRTKSGSYIRILHQIIPLEFDEHSYYSSLVLHTEITHIKAEGRPCFSIIGFEGETSYYNITDVRVSRRSIDKFTVKERQILKLVMEGKTSKLIATSLFISLHTVLAHRKNILAKTGCATTGELISKCVKEGWV